MKIRKIDDLLVKIGFFIYIGSILNSKAGINIGISLMILGFVTGIEKNIKKISTSKQEYKIVVLFFILYTFYDLVTPGFIRSFIIEIKDFYKITPLFIMPLYIKNESEIKKYIQFMVISFAVTATINIFRYDYSWRLQGLLGITNTGHISAMVLIFLAGMISEEKNKKIKIVQSIIYLIGLYMMILTGVRGAMISYIFLTIILVIIKNKFKAIFIIFLILLFSIFTLQKIKTFTNLKINDIKNEVSLNTRFEMWKVSVENLKKNSSFFGSGTGRDSLKVAFSDHIRLNSRTLIEPKYAGNPHSTYFLILSEKGIYIFSLFIFIFLIYIPWRIFLSKSKFFLFYAVIFSYYAYFILALTEDNWRTMLLRTPYLIVLILWLSFNEFYKEENNEFN